MSSLSCHFSYPSFNGLEKSLERDPEKQTKKPTKLGHLPVPLPLLPFSYPSSLLKWTETIFFVVVVTAASFIRPFVERHQNSHLFWWRPSPSPPAEKLLAVQRGRIESRDKVLVRGGRGEKQHGDRRQDCGQGCWISSVHSVYSCGNVTVFIETHTF